jgi:hypothetical protein
MIYEEAAIVHQGHIKLEKQRAKAGTANLRGAYDCFNLLRTCGQIRSEFTALYYQHARFALPKDDAPAFCTKLSKIGIVLADLTVLVAWCKVGQRLNVRPGRTLFTQDFLPILEMHYRHLPSYAIEVGVWNAQTKSISLCNSIQRALKVLLKGNEQWKNAIMKRHLSQVLIDGLDSAQDSDIRIIYRVPHEQVWMRRMLGTDREDEAFGVTLGFADGDKGRISEHIKISFGVYY